MKKLTCILAVLMAVTFATRIGFATEAKTPAKKAAKIESVSGDVVKVDAKTGTIVIKANNKDHTLKAEPKMLEGITVGEKVMIEKTGSTVKSIKSE